MFTQENWPHACFVNEDYRIILSYGAEIINQELEDIYYSTLIDADGNALFQKHFFQLPLAIEFINTSYGHWDFGDLEALPQGSGCDSCQAH